MPDEFRDRRFVLKDWHAVPLIILACSMLASAPTAGAASVEERRAAFLEVYAKAELGNWEPAANKSAILTEYVLWPDLRAAYLRSTLKRPDRDDDDIRQFLQAHESLRPARDLRYRYALRLAADSRYADYLEFYQRYFQELGIAKLDCLAVQAEIQGGRAQQVVERAHALWMTGKSQANECDPVFDYLKDKELLESQQYEARYRLAVEAKQFRLARYLSAPLPPPFRDEANSWLSAQGAPEQFVRAHGARDNTDLHRRQLSYAVERLAYRNPQLAATLWHSLRDDYAFTDQQDASTSRHVALWAARLHLPDAWGELQSVPSAAIDTEVQRWMARASLRQRNWPQVVDSIEAMDAEERAAEQWRYWHAYGLAQLDRNDESAALLEELAGERSYYGFLAADELEQGYELSHAAISADEAAIADLAARPELVRARELFFVGLDGRGRSEWDAALLKLSHDEKVQAVILAQRWGWHSRAIATAASVRMYDDLQIRFPLPYKDTFDKYSVAAQVRPGWALGIARSESLFMRDVRSSAGAIGLMQLMPATGRSTAKEINLPWSGNITLTDPASNIRLGTHYLGKMYDRFDNNLVLATAAYNAGPGNVDRWLPQTDALDARIWIENIPFNETRKYVRRVMETDVIFTWRLTGNVRRLSEDLLVVNGSQESGKEIRID